MGSSNEQLLLRKSEFVNLHKAFSAPAALKSLDGKGTQICRFTVRFPISFDLFNYVFLSISFDLFILSVSDHFTFISNLSSL